MVRLVRVFCLLFLVSSCAERPKRELPVRVQADTVAEVLVPEVDEPEPLVVAEEVISSTADESFVDFFYNFASDEVFQRGRVVFPLPFYKDSLVQRFSKDDWRYDPLFSKEEVYTVLFDTEDDMELEKDTSACSVQVDWMNFDSCLIKRYYFESKAERWYLEAMNLERMKKGDSRHEDFTDFYQKFVGDSVFQRERLNDPLRFVTADPEDEFQMMETTLSEGQWFAFRPPMPQNSLISIRFGQATSPDSPVKIVELKGFGNGFSNVLHFHRYSGNWKLVKFEDLSD